MNASKLTALLTGLAIPAPILILSRIGDGGFVARVIASVAWVLGGLVGVAVLEHSGML